MRNKLDVPPRAGVPRINFIREIAEIHVFKGGWI